MTLKRSRLTSTSPFSLGNQTIVDVPRSTPIWLAASCIDTAGQYERHNPALFGLVVAAGGLDDSIPPARVSGVAAADLPFDDGGYLEVTWTPNNEEDCVLYTIYALPASGFSPPTSAEGWPVVEVVPWLRQLFRHHRRGRWHPAPEWSEILGSSGSTGRLGER